MAGKYVRNNNEKFVNPYTFVGLEQSKKNTVNAVEYYSTNELLTGELDCTITVKTPLAILDVETKEMDSENHPSYGFYRVNNKLTIPGSTIRGEIRNLYETLTNSCMLTVDENRTITRRVDPDNEKPFSAGLLMLEKTGWVLYKAKAHSCDLESVMNMDICTNISIPSKNGRRIFGYSAYSEEFSGERRGYLFEKKEKILNDVDLVKKLISGLDYSVAEYRNPAINKNLSDETKRWYPKYEDAKEKGIIPVWYGIIDGNYYLSLAAIGRTAYNKTLKELIKDKVLCKSRNKLCPACLLFGMIGSGNDTEAMGSRVRFTDATVINNPELRSYTLKELGCPRSSYLPFYLKSGLNYDSDNAQIAGRKFYWHNCAAATDSSVFTTLEKNLRNSTVEVVGRGTTFGFKVYFDRVTKEQLENLVYCLTFGENKPNGNMCHKLGHGKPLGLGSVKISVDRLVERKLTDGYKLEAVEGDKLSDVIANPESRMSKVAEVKKVHNFLSVKDKNVCYPYVVPKVVANDENSCASHQWFSEARKKSNSIKLPLVSNNVQELFAFNYEGEVKETPKKERNNKKTRNNNYWY